MTALYSDTCAQFFRLKTPSVSFLGINEVKVGIWRCSSCTCMFVLDMEIVLNKQKCKVYRCRKNILKISDIETRFWVRNCRVCEHAGVASESLWFQCIYCVSVEASKLPSNQITRFHTVGPSGPLGPEAIADFVIQPFVLTLCLFLCSWIHSIL